MSLPLPFALATANPDKAREIVEIFVEQAGVPLAAWAASYGFVVDAPDHIATTVAKLPDSDLAEVEETGPTLEANARLKASALRDALELPAVADDTGLEVDVLDGRPGVRSARYAGEGASYTENVAKLLAELDGRTERRARFATVAIAAWPDGREVVARGDVHGEITVAPRGTNGFGYDPVFVPDDGGGRTFAEMSAVEKHAFSHRGRAFRALALALDEGR